MDRDGTLTEEVGYVNHPRRLRLLPRSAEAIRRLNGAGVAAVVVTNQAGLARGYFSEEILAAVNAALVSQLKDDGAHLDGVYVCTHHPTEGAPPYRMACDCRKPKPGLLLRAAAELGLDLSRATLVGDKGSDLEVLLGGAATAGHNVHAFGARVMPIGVIGADGAGEELHALFQSVGISTDGVVVERGRRTPVKTRIMAGGYQATRQQVVRLDREPAGEPQPTTEDALLDRLTALAPGAAAVVISDYGYGTVTPRLFECVKKIAGSGNAIVSTDSRYQLPRFSGVTAATPNEAE